MDNRQNPEIEFKLHGLTEEDHGRVPARLYARKLTELVEVLEAADIVKNGKRCHEYNISAMHMSQPTTALAEINIAEHDAMSSFSVIDESIEAIKTGATRTDKLAPVIAKIHKLSSGADKSYSFAEVKTTQDNIIRIDSFLHNLAGDIKKLNKTGLYKGNVFGTFDGNLIFVDVRGERPLIKLVLTAGGKEIDCICRSDEVKVLGEQLSQRVKVAGRAYYDGVSPMPKRVEVTTITPIKKEPDFERWKGAFNSFETDTWGELE